VSVWVE